MRSASITHMIRHYVARRGKVTEGHPHNAAYRAATAAGAAAHVGEQIAAEGAEPRLGSRVEGGAAAPTVRRILTETRLQISHHWTRSGSQYTSIRWPSGSRHLNAT